MINIYFTTTEKKTFSKLLSRAVNADDAFNIEELHGFLFGLAIIPEVIKPSEWLPIAFGEEMMEFDSEAEAKEMMDRLFNIYNRLCKESHEKRLHLPFDLGSMKKGDVTRIGDWAYGLYIATTLRPEVWGLNGRWGRENCVTEEMQELSSAFGVIIGVAKPELIPEIFDKADFNPEANEKDLKLRATLYALLPNAVATVQEHARLKAEEFRVGMPLAEKSAGCKKERVGRNEQCPCGSGKKHKRCCGIN